MPTLRQPVLILVTFSALVAYGTPALGQQPAPAAPQLAVADSSPTAAVLHGRAAADRQGTGGRFAGGYVPGLFLGLIGTGIAYAVASTSDVSVPALEAAQLISANANYSVSYQQGYGERLRSRRKSAALTGGLLGTLTFLVIYASATSGQ